MTNLHLYCYSCMSRLPEPDCVCPHCGHDNRIRQTDPDCLPAMELGGQYYVGKPLGRGGFGVTYIALDKNLERVVALKEYYPVSMATREYNAHSLRFRTESADVYRQGCARALEEGKLAARMDHMPGVVQIYNAFEANGTVYIVMEYIRGKTLMQLMQESGGRLPWAQVISLMEPLMRTLSAIHGMKVIHRDVSPDNIMIRDADGSAVLLDFGAAHTISDRTMSEHSVSLRHGYAPVEQYTMFGKQDGRIDEYALCATMYHALTGKRPADATERAFAGTEIAMPRSLGSDIPAHAEAALMKGLALKADDRYPDVAVLRVAMTEEPVPVMKEEPAQRPASRAVEVVPMSVPLSASAGVAPLLRRAHLFLEEKDWNKADEYFERVLDAEPENAHAYIGKLLVQLGITRESDLVDCSKDFENNSHFLKALRFSDEEYSSVLTRYAKTRKERIEYGKKEECYKVAQRCMDRANDEQLYARAAEMFEKLGCFFDAQEKAALCRQLAASNRAMHEEKRCEEIYKRAKSHAANSDPESQKQAAYLFMQIKGWKDADELASQSLMRHDELLRAAALRKTKAQRRKIILGTIAAVLVAVIAFVNQQAGNTQSPSISSAKVGDYITFGSYEQDGDTSNGKELIEWQVLDKQGDRLLVISRYALDCKPYNTGDYRVTWGTCTLRKWLNNDFLNAAFSSTAKARIPTVTVSAHKNPTYSTNPGSATQDKIFLLSITEANKYLASMNARRCMATAYTDKKGASTNSDDYCWWWLRSPGSSQVLAAYVNGDGSISMTGRSANRAFGTVRPALWIDLNP